MCPATLLSSAKWIVLSIPVVPCRILTAVTYHRVVIMLMYTENTWKMLSRALLVA